MEGIKHRLLSEEAINDGLGVLIREKRLYHGSSATGITQLNPAEETTVGEGIYFTSKPEDARGYATRRSRHGKDAVPTVYGARIENLKLLDLRNKTNVLKVLDGFKEILVQQQTKQELPWYTKEKLDQTVEAISTGTVKSLKEITFAHTKLFSEYVQSLGYDGLIAIEGGEGQDIGEHDTYLIFDPSKVGELTVET